MVTVNIYLQLRVINYSPITLDWIQIYRHSAECKYGNAVIVAQVEIK